MKKDWERLESWLRTNDSETLAGLNPPATDGEIRDMERKLGYGLPAGYVECLKIHGGQKPMAKWLFGGDEFLSIQNVVINWEVWRDLLEGGDLVDGKPKPDAGVQSAWWSKSWIPFTANGRGDHLCLDMAPASSGRVGQVIKVFHDSPARKLVAQDFASWFAKFVDSKIG